MRRGVESWPGGSHGEAISRRLASLRAVTTRVPRSLQKRVWEHAENIMETRVGVNSDIWHPHDKVDSELVEQCLQAMPHKGLR
jgi:hypothetical protein